MLDRVVDPIVTFNLANPGFKALFARPDMPAGLAEALITAAREEERGPLTTELKHVLTRYLEPLTSDRV